MTRTRSINLASIALMLIPIVANADIIYSENFDDDTSDFFGCDSSVAGIVDAGGFSGVGDVSGKIYRNSSTRNDGPGTGDRACISKLRINDAPSHSALFVEFDLLAIDSWDGSTNDVGGIGGPDYFQVNVGPANSLVWRETIDFRVESDGSISTSADAALIQRGSNLGFNSRWPDTVYHVGFLVDPHSATDFQMNFLAYGPRWSGGNDESWGIDNLKISTVPEPGTLALLGLGLVGMAARRRKIV